MFISGGGVIARGLCVVFVTAVVVAAVFLLSCRRFGVVHKLVLNAREVLVCDGILYSVRLAGLLSSLDFGLLDGLLQVLFPVCFPLKHVGDALFLIRLLLRERVVKLQHGTRPIGCTQRKSLPRRISAHTGEWAVDDLDRERGVVLLEKVVPHVQRAVLLDGKEYPGAPGRPAASRHVRRVILGGNNRRPQVFRPGPRGPVADGQEELGVEGVTLHLHHGSVMARERGAHAILRVLCLAVTRQHHAALGAHHKLGGPCRRVVLQRQRA
mmetsp:Transcript_11673/g.21030  ORF Transcript_11673/g.21030 Transcript_11673/m.21030 type:complete len:268 (+) Transcript_11673:244-1047(+)